MASAASTSVTHIRVVEDRWTFMSGAVEGNTLNISIDPTRKPALLNFYKGPGQRERAYGVGLIRRQGDAVEVLYRWGGEEGRPLDFEPPPDGFWTITMRRD